MIDPIDRHLASISLAGQRPRSVTTRGRVLRLFARSVPVLTATRGDLEAWLGRPLKPTTRKAYLAHLRGFYGWAVDEELLDGDPTAKIRGIKVPRGVPRPLQSEDLRTAVRGSDPRMKAWLLLMSLAGLRACEVSVLRPSDLLTMDGIPMLYLRETKGGGTATVPAHEAVVEALAALPVVNGEWWHAAPNYVSYLVGRHLRASGVEATAHQLRHTAGTSWYSASGHDLLVTARLLRHANVATAQVYTEIDPRRPAEVVRLVKVPA